MNAFRWVAAEIWTFEKLAYKTFNAVYGNAVDRGDYNSPPCTLDRRAYKSTVLDIIKTCIRIFPHTEKWLVVSLYVAMKKLSSNEQELFVAE